LKTTIKRAFLQLKSCANAVLLMASPKKSRRLTASPKVCAPVDPTMPQTLLSTADEVIE
jgi:hypothetical protein